MTETERPPFPPVRSVVHNTVEDIIERRVQKYMKELRMCICGVCYADVLAITLNRSKPHYVSSEMGENFAIADMLTSDEQTISLDADIISACMLVRDKPRKNCAEVIAEEISKQEGVL
ncbi:MAG: late competence development ComFB family protein [Oscillospiraceae bacterium]|jgi:competence protein ComFB|nr:late competence development ComFB family protein [Oscillospiraceae bacterium]